MLVRQYENIVTFPAISSISCLGISSFPNGLRYRTAVKSPMSGSKSGSFCAQWMWIRVAGSFGRWQNRKTEWASGRYLDEYSLSN
jgi:hypothetical protein